MKFSRWLQWWLISFSALLLGQGTVQAQVNYPTKPIRILVGFAAGGNTDIVTRTLAARMQDVLGQPVIVENKPGAGGVVATDFVAKAAPDGYTLLMSSLGPHTISPSLLKSVGFDPLADLAPISNVTFNALVLMVNPTVPARSVSELINYAKANPGKLNFGSSGVSGTTHLSGEVFNTMTGTKLVHVAFRGGPPAIGALLAGDIQMMFANISDALPQIRGNKVRPLAVTSTKRVPQLPDLPTLAESGLSGYDVGPWNGLVAPAKTPPEIIGKLAEAVQRITREQAFRDKMFEVGSSTIGDSPEQFRNTIRHDITRWAKIIQDAGIKPE
jgi:tripartite-type tricarboxylate transporter receptor subunit TctC